MGTRLGLSLGTHSIGWAILEKNEGRPTNILKAGVRIFSDGRDPRTGDPLAVERRRARAARVRRDRLLRRKSDLRKSLTRLGLFPACKVEQQKLKSLNPYELRARAVTKKLTPYELGRALIHLSQRRGFQSNRKNIRQGDKKEEKDRDLLDQALKESSLTLGQYLYERLRGGKGTRARPGEGLTTLRGHYKHEFAKIREIQKPYHSLRDDDWDRIGNILFFQRSLKPPRRGYCQIYFKDKEERARRAMPSFQRFRMEKKLVELRTMAPDGTMHYLTPDRRAKLRRELLSQKTMGFGKIRALLRLDEPCSFNRQTDRGKDLPGDATGALMLKKEHFGNSWNSLDLKKQDEIVARVLDEENPETLRAVALKEWGLSEHQAQALVRLNPAKLERGTAPFSTRALYELIALLREQGLSVTEAVSQIRGEYDHCRRGEPELEYYGAIVPDSVVPQPRAGVEDERVHGRINNPTFHIGLNQLRRLINEIIAEHGLPDEMVVELSRELKLSREARKNLAREQKADQELNKEAEEHIKGQGLAVNGENILRYKLWKELFNPGDINDRRSPYSGRNISSSQLFGNEIEIDHILPLSRTLDDSYNNKTLCFADEKRMKGNFSPHEACHANAWPFDHDEILNRALYLPGNKSYRFESHVMERFECKGGGFIARQLTDAQYLSKVTRRYLESLYPAGDKIHVRVIPGHLTAKIRGQWELNSILSGGADNDETLNDHRYHAIDAIIIGCTDQALMQRAASMAAQLQKLEFDPPFGTAARFRRRVKGLIDPLIVSHRPDHGCQGSLHEATNYGIIENPNEYEAANNYNVVYRKPFVSLFAGLDPRKAMDKAAEIRDARLRHPLINLLKGASSKGDVAEIVEAFARQKGIRHIRLLKKEATIIPVEHSSSGKRFGKGVVPGNINNVGLWRMPCGEIKAVGRSLFEVNQTKADMNRLKPHPAAKLEMTLYKKDMVRVVKSGQTMTCTVVSMSPANGTCTLRPHNFAKSEELFITFGRARDYQLRKISITSAGKIHDPGPIF